MMQNCQSNPEDQEQSRKHNPPRLQATLQSYSVQNKEVLAQKQIYGTMEKNRDPRIKPTHYGQFIFHNGSKNILGWPQIAFRFFCRCYEKTLKEEGFQGDSVVKNLPANGGDLGLSPQVGKIPQRRQEQPTLVFLPGESHGQRSLVGYRVTKSQT